ncbi:MAG: penicillin-binding protein 1C [Bacteroidetes bacterium]|nr:penicillin-binding protein 1C [Bacteroidota bacterium]
MTFLWFSPDPLGREPLSTVLLDRHGRLLGARLASDGQWRFAPADSLPEKYVAALLAYEDKRFRWHPGIDPIAVSRAIFQNIRAGKIVSGGSTISMQLARISVRYKNRGLKHKIAEAWLALSIELKYSKKSILRHYASVAPFGGNINGLHAASWRYFGHPPELLSWAEAALLAVLPNSPANIHPEKNVGQLQQKRDRLLRKLHRMGKISSTDLELALTEPLPQGRYTFPDLAPHFLEQARKEGKTGFIHSTLDADVQQIVLQMAENQRLNVSPTFVHNLAVIIRETETGNIIAYMGNAHPQSKVPGCHNDMAASMRSPGSMLKPLLFASALDEGLIHPQSLLPDIPSWWGSYSPRNFDNSFSGAVEAQTALQRSLNIPFAWLLKEYGIEKFINQIHAMGFSGFKKSAEHYGISLILGGAEVNLLELTKIYARLARQALHGDGSFPLSHEACRLTAEALTGLNRPETVVTSFDAEVKLPLAWKTGTSFGQRDAWAVGFNPHYVIGIWVGNADGSGRPGLTGASAAGPLLFDLAFALMRNQDFFPPASLLPHRYQICQLSGYSPGPDCPTISVVGTPAGSKVKTCSFHQLITTDTTSHWRISEGCRPPFPTKRQTWFVLPPVMSYYYQIANSAYRPLPPLFPGCNSSPYQIMDFAYPPANASIFLPRDFSGNMHPTVFVLIHQQADLSVHWHLDGNYIGTTTGPEHRMPILADAGEHVVTVVDESGQRLSRKVFFLNPKPGRH